MGTHVINIDPFNPISVRLAERQYRNRVGKFNQNVQTFLQRLTDIGAEEAQATYGHAVSVTAVPIGTNEWAIQADGRAVVFLEFGAGDTVNTGNRYASAPELTAEGVVVESKAWSREHAKQYSEHGYWVFGGKQYTHVTPLNAMEKAYAKMIESIPTLLEEVFR